MTNVEFFQFQKVGTATPAKHQWLMAAGVDTEGTVYVPGATHPAGERGGFLCAGYDGTACVMRGDHVYFPADWVRAEIRFELHTAKGKLRRELEQTLVSIDRMEREARQAAGQESRT